MGGPCHEQVRAERAVPMHLVREPSELTQEPLSFAQEPPFLRAKLPPADSGSFGFGRGGGRRSRGGGRRSELGSFHQALQAGFGSTRPRLKGLAASPSASARSLALDYVQ
jgi:hypothetical protein